FGGGGAAAGGPRVVRPLHFSPEAAVATISIYRRVVLAGQTPPVSFFGYPGAPSFIISPEQRTSILASPEEDVADALEALADALGAPVNIDQNSIVQTPPRPTGKITPETLSAVVAALLPENAVVMDESNTR